MAGLVWLASYPKSGNTWVRLILANLLAEHDTPVSINRIELNSVYHVAREIIDEMTQLDSELLTSEETDRLRLSLMQTFAAELRATNRNAYVKVHDAYNHLPDGTALLGSAIARAAIYIIRDPRDVAVSCAAYFESTIEKTIARMADHRFVLAPIWERRMLQVPQRVLDWSGHVRSWTLQRDVPVLVVRYEDLLAEPLKQCEAIARFLDIPATPDRITRAVRFSGFSELQRQEVDVGFIEHRTRTAPFFRSGRAGAWAATLTPDQAARITETHKAVMTDFGYA